MEYGNEAAFGGMLWLFIMGFSVVMAIAQWKVFEKAGQPGWACLVPIYNIIILLRVTRQPEWWIILFFVPVANFVIAIRISIELARVFGQSGGFGAGLILLPVIFYPILGFGDAQYVGGVSSSPIHREDYSDQCRTDTDSRFHQ